MNSTSESALPKHAPSKVEPLHELQRMSWLQVRVMGKLILTKNYKFTTYKRVGIFDIHLHALLWDSLFLPFLHSLQIASLCNIFVGGEMQQTMAIRALPQRDGFKIHVRLDSICELTQDFSAPNSSELWIVSIS
jgi:hypothetical protein